MATNDSTALVSETLEHEFAVRIAQIMSIIDQAPGLADAPPERLAILVNLARELKAKAEMLQCEIVEAEDEHATARGISECPAT